MIWDGSSVFALWGYKPITRPALQWVQDSAGYWSASDRGSDQDIFETSMVFRGPESELTDLEIVLAGNRESFNITCGIGEEIFGADINYFGSLSVVVTDYGEIDRVSYAQYSMPLRLRLLAPTFKDVMPSLSALRLSSWRYGAFSTFDIGKGFSLAGTPTYSDHRADVGVFRGEFTQTQAEMEAIRSYLLATARGNTVPFPTLGGITYPFGGLKGSIETLSCKVLEWEDLGRENFTDWKFRMTLAEAQGA